MGALMTRLLLVVGLVALVAGCRSPDAIARNDPGAPVSDVAADGDVATADPLDTATEATAPDAADDGTAGDVEREGTPEAGEVADEATDLPPETLGTPVARACELKLTWKPPVTPAQGVGVCGAWNNWGQVGADPNAARTCDAMTAVGDGSWTIVWAAGKPTTPGEYAYKLCVDGCANGAGWFQDAGNPLVLYDGTQKVENSKLIVPDCNLPLILLDQAASDWNAKTVDVTARLYTGVDGTAIEPSSLAVEVGGEPYADYQFDVAKQAFHAKLTGLQRGKYSLTFHAANAHGAAEPLFVPVWLEEHPFAWTDAVLYFAMTDRFANGDPSNDAPASCLTTGDKANWLGGDFAGIRQKIEAGYFDELGVNAIWISPINDNPDGCYPGDLGRQYTAYHGYFPVSMDQTEPHFGSLDDLRKMVKAAHEHGIRVLADLVGNHVHEDAPAWAQHKGWFNQAVILCGDANNWNDHPLDCWFQPYLPDLDYRVNDAANAVTDAAVDWVLRADLDGFRVDAVKHMWHNFGRTLKYKLAHRVETSGVPFYLVGETYVGDWGGGTGEELKIKEYLSGNELSGQFNFPLYWAILDAVARGQGDLGRLADVLAGSLALYGPDAIMSNFLGNHDVPRFISHAAGVIADKWGNGAKDQGWLAPPTLPASPEPFQKLTMAFAFLMSVPGVPLIYYGDEVGMPGAGDPDNRRFMQFDGLADGQKALRTAVAKLGKARGDHAAMRIGKLTKLWSDPDGLAVALVASGDAAVVVLNRGAARTLTFSVMSAPGVPTTVPMVDVLTGTSYGVTTGNLAVALPKYGAAVLVP